MQLLLVMYKGVLVTSVGKFIKSMPKFFHKAKLLLSY